MRENIKQIRKSSKYTQQQIADRLEISKSLYQKIEEGKRKYDLHFIVAFSRIMKTELSKIIDLNEFINKPHFNFNNE
jgi:transcriptional regulator with XRE-family HTH domain